MAYEHKTYESILQEMIERINYMYPDLDTREGSIIYNALAPAAMELANKYVELDNIRNESFISTASRESALLMCDQMGMDTSQFEAYAGTHKGEFDVEVELGSRWNCGLYNYEITEFIGQNQITNYYEYQMLCETLGSEPNNIVGDLIPIDTVVDNLTHAKIVECLIEGENETSDENIKIAYYNFVTNDRSDGNVAQYKEWCDEFDGIGNYKVFPLWNGLNTVKVSILSTSNGVAQEELMPKFHKYLSGDNTYRKYTSEDWVDPNDYETYFNLPPLCNTVDTVTVNGKIIERAEWNDKTEDGCCLENGYFYYVYGTRITVWQGSEGEYHAYPLDENDVVQVYYNLGMGDGVAPIGAIVTVDTATEVPIDVSATITMKNGYTDTTSIETALSDYFSEIAYTKSVVAYMTLGAIILGVDGVESVNNLKINGGTADITLTSEQIPVLGTKTWTVNNNVS